MTMMIGELGARITLLDKNKFEADIDGVGQRFGKLDNVGSSAGKAISSSIKAAAATTVIAGTVAAAYGVQVFKTGAAYNTLQQTSRAAMTTLMGGAKEANAQMDKLDDFARNSPFSKATFITAQQQMIGFGIEAKKVIPYLGAIQNAVAATGGSNESIAEIVEIMAKIQSSSKITADDFAQFGNRGVDAATIIGTQMGKTGAEIRAMVTKGVLPAEQALDALAAGMETKFAGAAANVKNTMTGAADRVKAATRDIGAALAEPFVSKNGGGLAVKWANDYADVLRGVEKAAGPMVSMLMGRAVPAIQAVDGAFTRAKIAVNGFSVTRVDSELNSLGAHAPAIAAVGGAVVAMGMQGIPVLGRFLPAINPVAGALLALAATSPQLRSAGGEILTSLSPLIPVAVQLGNTFSTSLTAVLPVVAGGLTAVARVAEVGANAIAAIPTPVLAAGIAFLGMRSAMSALEGPGKALSGVVSAVTEHFQASKATAEAMGGSVSVLGAAAHAGAGGVTAMGGALKAAFLSNPIGIALTVAAGAVAIFAAANADAAEKVAVHNKRTADLRQTLTETGGAATAATRDVIAASIAEDGIGEAAKSASVAHEMLTDAITGASGGAQIFKNTMRDQAKAAMEAAGKTEDAERVAKQLGLTYNDIIDHTLGFSEAQGTVGKAFEDADARGFGYRLSLDKVTEAVGGSLDAQQQLVGFVEAQSNAFREAQAENAAYRQAQRDLAAAMTESARSNQAFNDALSVARDTTKDMETRVSALKQALDELEGGTKSAAAAELDFAQKNNTLRDSLAATDQAGIKLYSSFLDGAGAIDLTNSAGVSFGKSLTSLNGDMLAASARAYDAAAATGDLEGATRAAREAGEQYIGTIRQTMLDMGLTVDQADALIGKYFSMPGTVSTLVTDSGSIDETTQAAIGLANEMRKLPADHIIEIKDNGTAEEVQSQLQAVAMLATSNPSGDVTIKAPTAPGVIDALKGIGFEVETLADRPGEIRLVTPNLAQTEGKIDEVTAKKREAAIQSVVKGGPEADRLLGDIADRARNADIRAQATGLGETGVQLDGVAKANRNADIKAKATGLGEATTDINRVANASYRATVHVSTSGLEASFASIERLKGAAVGIGVLKPTGSAIGNIFNHGTGGTSVQAFANGGTISTGMYRGGPPLLKFAEPETNWEAFISGKHGEEARNRKITVDAASRLGMEAYPKGTLAGAAGQGAVQVSLDGMRVKLIIGGQEIDGIIDARIDSHDQNTAHSAGLGWSE
ncbi:tape measure protein [Mycetocola spongiae]|uniref:tape measure protein n=1 Tax=Mycetocola spongiae TaxID=2859226 RepID=UPI001CF38693|nr:tape measure protein [Mycetocola spongiae]UCR89244.1 tape measure protein [Mycetocola spongiae]